MSILVNRCSWATKSQIMMDYHDQEWGRPIRNDLDLFAKLMTDCFQAGLSWSIILNKRTAFLEAFDGFNPYLMANYDESKVNELLNNKDIVRNKLKILAMIHNSKCYLKHFSDELSFTNFIWKYSKGKTIDSHLESLKDMKATSDISDQMSKDLKKLGFKFVGSTVIYAFLQAVGVYNDHIVSCFCHKNI